MTVVYAGSGMLLVLLAITDAVLHCVALRRGGPIARRMGNALWALVVRTPTPRGRSLRLARTAGPMILLLTFLLWSLMLWLGWALIFTSDPQAVVHGTTGEQADFRDRLYYAGFVITTLGIGNYEPRGALYQNLTVIAAGMGFFMITLFVTYALSVLSAVVFKRTLACNILGLGRTPGELVANAWQHGRFASLHSWLLGINNDLVALAQKHLAYPALHYFHTLETGASPAVAVAVLDEALTLIECGVAEEDRPDGLILHTVRDTIIQLADTVSSPARAHAPVPPAPSLDKLRDAGVPILSDAEFTQRVHALDERRRKLHLWVDYDARSWQAVSDT